ncbi:MAG: PilC/PilY family type IV pilus protein [Sorangiineae bacterium]|nr:PilC/PilY family type IV pilus protein [Polyangiaceae bacterium]MEB2323310.1 PilC/PilY family type IV pilus protein [Sorangiineae bacterium]
MNTRHRIWLAILTAGGLSSMSGAALGQADVNPPPPNALLLVDSSGSMEYMASSASYPSCDPTGAAVSGKSRWIDLVEVLTGGINDYRCDAQSRSSSAFLSEYSLGGLAPYDYQYFNPYHRLLSGTCTPGPNQAALTANAYDFPSNAILFHPYNSLATTCSTFSQANDGLLDSFRDRVRFGLMTFDTLPDPGTGVSGTTADYATGNTGAWSYFVGPKHTGKPAGCDALTDLEVGARNAAAPPWEGRMVAFGDPAAGGAAMTGRNDQIQQILLTLRPYGATPIAGMMDDARDFLWNDKSADKLDSTKDFGPYRDPYVAGGCRKNYVILLSDGEPNLDLRPSCAMSGTPAGVCPYPDKPEEVAFDLAHAASPAQRVKTFVIGFAVSKVNVGGSVQIDCKTLTSADLDPNNAAGACATYSTNSELQACCSLNRVAASGDTGHAYFADDRDELRAAMSAILSQIASSTTSRTLPVFAAAGSVRDPFAGSYRFYSSFEPQQFAMWKGVLDRQRYICKVDPLTNVITPEAQAIDPSLGDDFVANVNSGKGPARRFFSVLADAKVGARYSERSIRPALGSDDGAGLYSGTLYSGDAASFNTATPAAAMSIDGTTCASMTATQCRDKYLKWNLGLDNGTIYQRCKTPGSTECNLVGDIYHSTPRLVGRPGDFLRDESYALFAQSQATRPLVLYTSTNDGFLHAFKVARGDTTNSADAPVNSLGNNELWAFLPPAVLPSIPSQYPGTHVPLLDGIPVVKDVIATGASDGSFRLERTPANARSGATTWRTILVQSFGATRGGYFALDVTNPVPDSADPKKGPKFLWQLTKDADGNALFGQSGSTPLITTLFFNDSSGAPREVAVALLPGGSGGAPTGAQCSRQTASPSWVDSNYPIRSKVNCYSDAASRSLTVVRLDTGEIIRTFRRSASDAPAGLAATVIASPIDSPITGQPVAFPGDTGAIADRVFVGDADGTLWRVDLSATDPDNWTMKIFSDPYSGKAFDAGQPIATAPVLSLDELGNLTIAYSTGDQEVLTADAGMQNYAVSLSERLVAGVYTSKVNWATSLTGGERVAGPITLFNGVLYFSSFQPEPSTSSNVCRAGSSRVWGVDYLLPKEATDLSKGGKERLPSDPSAANPTYVQYIDSSSTLLEPGATIFGVGVMEQPTCTDESTVTDPYFGTGSHTSVTSTTAGKFQLVMHTGTAGSAALGGKSNVLTIDLPTPPSTPRIDSWAAITE